ncbi:MAG TPA: hypothetical protein VG649_21525 [Candidatus Angelobacter sp.]|jgi:hypothetical protein|nr:hypothetical protein [Candidatus Angelobacter sp.]
MPGKPHRIALMAIACLQGGYMVIDGIHVLTSHSYISGRVGPWAQLVRKTGFSEYDMGPVFVVLGSLWLIGGFLNLAKVRAGAVMLLLAALISLSYLIFGTVLSLAALVILWRQGISKGPRKAMEKR